jgi:integrase
VATWRCCVKTFTYSSHLFALDYGTTEFDNEYRAALSVAAPAREATPSCSSLAWLIARYRETTAWTNLSTTTKKRRDNILAGVMVTAGTEPYSRIIRATIEAGRERRAKTPHQARHFLDTMRGLFRWALAAGLVKADPTLGVPNLPRKRTEGFIPWTEEHAIAYEKRWPPGTRQRVWLDVLLYTGLRRGDAVRVGRQHARGGSIKAEKNGVEVPVTSCRCCRRRSTPGRAGI